MAELANQEAFRRFQPLCVKLTREHTADNVQALYNMLQTPTNPSVLQQLQEYILFPLRIILKQSKNKSENLYTDVVRCQTLVLGHTEVTRFEMFQDIFTSLCILMSSPDPQQKAAAVSEELKLAVVQCLSALINSSSLSVLEHAYMPGFLPPLGHAVSLLLHLVATEGMRELRMAAINCLNDLAALNRKVGKRLKLSAADTFASFLPGITMAMTNVATGDPKQGHLITKTSISTWCKLVCLVIGDGSTTSESNDPSKMPQDPDADKPYHKLVVTRSTDWVAMTAKKLAILVSKMAPLSNNNNWRVRLAMVEWADMLLQKCTKSLGQCVSPLLEVLVSRVNDDYKNISAASRQALHTFQQTHVKHSKPLVAILEENLYNLATSLPRLMTTTDDEAKHADLCLFNGYLQLLGVHVGDLLQSSSHLHHISTALLQVLELDCTGLAIIQDKTPAVPFDELNKTDTHFTVRKTFRHFTDDKIYQDLTCLCRLLGYYGDLDLVVDHFLERFVQSSLHRKQAAFVLNQLLLGSTGEDVVVDLPGTSVRDKQYLANIVRTIVDEYLQPEHWNLITTNQSEVSLQSTTKGPDWQIVPTNQHHRQKTGLTMEQMNSNILQTCLLLEGIATCAKVLGADFQPLLIDVLYPVLEKLGDDNHTISQTAYSSLIHIAQSTRYSCVEDLLQANADYLVNSISLRLRHLVNHPKAPLVLMVTVTHSNKHILPLVDDTVVEVLECLDQHYGDRAVLFLRVLQTLVTAIGKWFPSVTDTTSNSTLEKSVPVEKSTPEKSVPVEKSTPEKSVPVEKSTPEKSVENSALEKSVENSALEKSGHMKKSTLEKSGPVEKSTLENSGPVDESAQEIVDYFKDYLHQRHVAESLEEEFTCHEQAAKHDGSEAGNDGMDDDDVSMDTDVKKEPPKHVVMVAQVLERCVHLLASPDPRLRLLVLDTISQCAISLQDYPDQLLPLIHKLWPPFVLRFTDEEQLVIIKALTVLKILGDTSGDFIRQRVVTDIIPKLTALLRKLAPTSEKAGAAYRFTVSCRLQLSILRNLGPLCTMIGLGEHQMAPVLHAALPYLSSRQHPEIQEVAVDSWRCFARQDSDCVWLHLNNVYCPQVFTPPHSCFKPVQMAGSTKRNEFADNIQRVLQVL